MNVRSLFGKGVAFAKVWQLKEALNCYDEAIKINPECFYAWQNRGFIMELMGMLPEALKCFEKTIELIPNDAGAWQNKGGVLFCLDKCEEAIECFDKAIELDPGRGYARTVREEAKDKLFHQRR